MSISGDRIAFLLGIFVIIISPFENITGIESIVYPIVAVLLMFTLGVKKQIKKSGSLFLILYLIYAFVTSLWTKAESPIYGMRITILMFIVLSLFTQFDFAQQEYDSL